MKHRRAFEAAFKDFPESFDKNVDGSYKNSMTAARYNGWCEAKKKNVHFSSDSNEWNTPDDFYAGLDAIHKFTLDPCATPENAKCRKFFTKDDDGLKQNWGRHTVFMNPPYGRGIGEWMKKAYESSLAGATVVCLVPARTDTVWWNEFAVKGDIEFIRGRLKFSGHKNSAPFPSALVTYRRKF